MAAAEARNQDSEKKIPCRLLGTGVRSFRRTGREGREVARSGRLRAGKATLTIGPSALILGRGNREILGVPIRNVSRVEVYPFSVNRQLRGLMSGSFRSATWLGTAKGAVLVLSTFFLMDNPPVQIPRLVSHLPFLLAHVAISIPLGFVLHLPFRLLPGAWQIRGPILRLRFELMDGRAFDLLVLPEMRNSVLHLLRETGLMVYPYPHQLTLLDRAWAVRRRGEAAIRRFCSEIF